MMQGELNPAGLDHEGGGVRAALVVTLLTALVFGLLYPLLSVAINGLLFPLQASGSPIAVDGKVVGSSLIAQPFADARYFSPRPSAAGYNPTAASGSNLGPSNPALAERIAGDAAKIAEREGVAVGTVPLDLVTASGGGLDPHISVAGAQLQAARVASARGVSEATVRAAIDAHTEAPSFGVFGQARVNVLLLNLALDRG